MHPVTKALGLKWNTRTDSLVFMIELDSLKLKSEKLCTKRELASLAAKIFDPMGVISPFTVRSKLLLQSLWTQGVGWDDESPEETSRKWVQWVQELSELEQLHIPRSYIDWPLSRHAKVEYLVMHQKLRMPPPSISELFSKKGRRLHWPRHV